MERGGLLSGQREMLAQQGRNGDTQLSHTTEGELVVPRGLLSDPGVRNFLRSAYADAGLDFERFVVGSPAGPTNPKTGAEEFFDDGSSTASEADANDDGTTSAAESAAADSFSGGGDSRENEYYDYAVSMAPAGTQLQRSPAAQQPSGNFFERDLGLFNNPITGKGVTPGDIAKFGLGFVNPAFSLVSLAGLIADQAGGTPSKDNTPGTPAGQAGEGGNRFVFDPTLGRIVDTASRSA